MCRRDMRRGIMVALTIIAGIFLLNPGLTFAGVGGSDTPTVPATVNVGQTNVGGWTFTIENDSKGAEGLLPMEVKGIFLTTACGSASNNAWPCLPADQEPPLEITINSPATGVAGACAGTSFTVAPTGINPNEYQFTPLNPPGPVILAPSSPGGPNATCTVNFTVNINQGPVNDSSPAAGKQTSQLAKFTLQVQNGQETASGYGTSTTTVNPCNPTIVTTPNPDRGVAPTTLNDSATLTEVGACSNIVPTGTITFKLYDVTDPTCSALTPICTRGPVTVNGNGTYSTPSGCPVTLPGVYHWIATYTGDVSNNSVSSICANEAVPLMGIVTAPNPAKGPLGTVLNDCATLSGGIDPTGSITFKLFGPNNQTCSDQGAAPVFTKTVTVNGNGTFCTTPGGYTTTAPGTYHWIATYSGDANDPSVSSICADEAVSVMDIVTAPDPTKGKIGTVLNDCATLSGGIDPTGTITCKLFGPNNQTCSDQGAAPVFTKTMTVNGSGTYCTAPGGYTTTAPGVYHWICTYSGDANDPFVSSICADEAVPVIGIVTAPNPTSGLVGTELNDCATLSGGIDPTGSITFKLFGPNNQTCSDQGAAPVFTKTVTVNGNGSYCTTPGGYITTEEGTYHWIATYSGDANDPSVTSICASEAVVIKNPSGGGESPYIGIVGNDCVNNTGSDPVVIQSCVANPFYFSPKHRQFLFDQEALDVPVCSGSNPPVVSQTRVPKPPAGAGCEQFRSNKPINQAEICDTGGRAINIFKGEFEFDGEPNAVITKQSAGYFEWWIRLPLRPNGEINICIQCGVLKPNTFLPLDFEAIKQCAAETGERVGRGFCTRNQVDEDVNPIVNSALPKITVWAYPGPFANENWAPFRLTAYKNPDRYRLSSVPPTTDDEEDPPTPIMKNSGSLQVLDGSVNARVLLKSCMDKCIIAKLPVTDQVNARGDTEQDLEAGDLIKVRLDVPNNNTVDIYCHSQSTKIMGIGVPE